MTKHTYTKTIKDMQEVRDEYRNAIANGDELAAAEAADMFRILRDWVMLAGRTAPSLTAKGA